MSEKRPQNRYFLSGLTLIGLGLFSLLLAACGYTPPADGGKFEAKVVIVTPTPNAAQITADTQATIAALPTQTPTPIPPTPVPTTAAPAPAPANQATAAPKPTLAVSDNTYTVKEGDTLLGIAINLKVDYDELVKLNKIDDPSLINIGQKLKLPPKKP